MKTKRLIAILAGLLLDPCMLPAQPSPPQRVPVTIVLADQLAQPDAPFVLHRRPTLAPQDVIVVRSEATVNQLSDAIRALIIARQAGGDTARVAGKMRVRPHTSGAAAGTDSTGLRGRRPDSARLPRAPFPWAERVLRDLRRAEKREVAGIGAVQAVEIWLPPQTRRPRRR